MMLFTCLSCATLQPYLRGQRTQVPYTGCVCGVYTLLLLLGEGPMFCMTHAHS